MSKKSYLPQLAKEINYLGKYAFEHRLKLIETTDETDLWTDEEKEIAKKLISELINSFEVYRKFWLKYTPR